MVKLEVTIDDQQWPKLKMVGVRTALDGGKSTSTEIILHDQAYNKFEGELHNLLRPMVSELINRRKR